MLAGANGIGHNSLPGEEFGEEEVYNRILCWYVPGGYQAPQRMNYGQCHLSGISKDSDSCSIRYDLYQYT